MSKNNSLIYHGSKEKHFLSFLLGFICILVCLVPIIIAEGGYFVYYGDYNAQQIPFYILGNNSVRSGQLGWNWFTDLGSDFLTSYSFYFTGSPFFWLTAVLPRSLVTISMPFLLALKHGIASVTAYAYIRRFVRNKNAALIGGLLYSFSGFQIFNIFFNHFQDVTAFFPLMLIALEEHINNNKKGFFALSVSLMAFINYFFFTGQAVFLVIYYLVRMKSPDFNASWKKFGTLAIEAVLGTMIACVLLLPSALTIIGNYRVSERLYGQDMILYSDKTRIIRIIQSFFMPSDVPAMPNLFSTNNGKWASIGGYLPLFSMVGVITFLREKKKHWASRLTLVCIICAFIPILNSFFYALNASYYARWFYMPILIFAMMTAQTLDDEEADAVPAMKICGVILAAFGIISLLPKKNEDGKVVFLEFANDIGYFGVTLAVAGVSLIAAVYIFSRKKASRPYMKRAAALTAAAAIVCTLTTVLYGAVTAKTARKYIDASVNGADGVYEEVSEDNFFRIDISQNYDNYPMSWGLPSMRAFQSVVSSSIMEFYDSIGIQRDVASRPETENYTLRGLFSVKYYYNSKDESNEADIEKELPGFKYVSENEYFEIYENTLYIPMGFGYDTYISQEKAAEKGDMLRQNILMKALVLSDEQIEKYSDILTEITPTDSAGLTKTDYTSFCNEKLECCSSSFNYDSYGFESEITLDKPQLVFFSVPYSEGWTAEVNGEPVDVEKVSYGFMAVRADAGENTIVFKYRTPGLWAGFLITLAGGAGLAVYLIICRKKCRKDNCFPHTHYYDYISSDKLGAADDYCRRLTENK
ncbi:MAG: YfhO family protein [Ruminococcus sp.]|nr:YfhO family protein [Ruminococcus sp.]